MGRWTVKFTVLVVVACFAISCSDSSGSPVTPIVDQEVTTGSPTVGQTHLWGYYDIYLDAGNETIDAVPNRGVMFAANVVDFVNGNPSSLMFTLHTTPIGSGYIDADIDVTMTHPFPGMPEYNGYDVMGVLDFVPDITWDNIGNTSFDAAIDHSMRDDPFDKDGGGPDGYTRWFNAVEFGTPGILGYTPGNFATNGFTPSSTLRPYKYFADGFGSHEDLWTFLNDNAADHGVFSSGSENTRNYYIRFYVPTPGVKYGYSIIARWEGENPSDHPANAPEAVACSVTVTDDVYYIDPTDNGGNLILDISLFDWASQPGPGGVMDDYLIKIESTVLSSAYSFNASEMTPTGGGANFSTYHCEIPADNVAGTLGNEFWVMVEYPGLDYKNEYGVTNLADDPLAAFFRYDLYVSSGLINQDPVCDMVVLTVMPVEGWAPIPVEFNALGSYDPEGGPLSFEWDFNGGGVFGDPYDSGTDGNPTKEYNFVYSGDVCVKVSDLDGGEAICCVDVDIAAHPSKNIQLRSSVEAYDLAVNHWNGDLLILYSDGQVWKYQESSYYGSGTHHYTTNIGYNRLDVSPGGASIAGGPSGGSDYAKSYSSGGGLLEVHTAHNAPCGPYGCVEVLGYCTGMYYNNHGVVMGYVYAYCMNGLVTFLAPNYDQEWTFNYMPPGYMATRLAIDVIKGCEGTDYDNTYIYFIEGAPEFSVERYYQIGLTYAGVGWGRVQSNDMDGFNDPQDITRDNNNDYYILDWLSTGDPRVKKYTEMGAEIGYFGDMWTISGDPLRIEGSDYNGNIFVLHTDGLSIFTPGEMP